MWMPLGTTMWPTIPPNCQLWLFILITVSANWNVRCRRAGHFCPIGLSLYAHWTHTTVPGMKQLLKKYLIFEQIHQHMVLSDHAPPFPDFWLLGGCPACTMYMFSHLERSLLACAGSLELLVICNTSHLWHPCCKVFWFSHEEWKTLPPLPIPNTFCILELCISPSL